MALDSLSRVNKHMSSDRGGFRQKVNVPVLVAWLCLLAYGSLVIWAASLTIAEASFTRQLVGIGLGAILAFLCWRSDFSGLAGMTTILLVVDLIVLFSPYIPGLSYNAKGMTGWIKIPLIGLTFQPVELAKIITIFFMASLGAQYNGRIDSVREYAKLCGMLAIPFGAAVVAGDLGSGLVVFFSGACIIMMSGPKKEWVLCTIALLVGAVSLLLALDSVLDSMLGKDVLLKQYQMNRLLVFINPESDTSQSGYNLLQSMIAVGSGGFFGKGIGNASQSGAGFFARGAYRFHLRPALRGVRLRGGARPACVLRLAHLRHHSHRPSVGFIVLATCLHRHRGHVDVSALGGGGDVHWAHAHHRHSLALHQLRLIVHADAVRRVRHRPVHLALTRQGPLASDFCR